MVPLTFKVNDSPTSYTRAMLIVRTSDLRNQLKPRIVLNPKPPIARTRENIHEGEEQIMNIPCPLEFLKRGDNAVSILFDGNYYNFKGGVQVKAMELRFYR